MKTPNSNHPRERYRERKRLQIWSAMLTLLDKKPLEKITVQELCDNCAIYRTTFYNHFHDIYDLIDFGTKQIIMEWNIEELLSQGWNEENIVAVMENLVHFIERYRRAILNMGNTKFREEILQLTSKKMEKVWTKLLSDKYQEKETAPRVILSSKFVCGGISDLIDYWTQTETITTQELQEQVGVAFSLIVKCL